MRGAITSQTITGDLLHAGIALQRQHTAADPKTSDSKRWVRAMRKAGGLASPGKYNRLVGSEMMSSLTEALAEDLDFLCRQGSAQFPDLPASSLMFTYEVGDRELAAGCARLLSLSDLTPLQSQLASERRLLAAPRLPGRHREGLGG